MTLFLVSPANLLLATQSTSEYASLKSYLSQLDVALDSRDPKKIATLADVDDWLVAGYPDIASLTMIPLPPNPLTRKVAENKDSVSNIYTVLYIDGVQRVWHVSLRFNAEKLKWLAIVRQRTCPSGGIVSQYRSGQHQLPAPVTTWTILECNAFPK